MKTRKKASSKKLTLNKETITVLTKFQQRKLNGGANDGPKGGDGFKTGQAGD